MFPEIVLEDDFRPVAVRETVEYETVVVVMKLVGMCAISDEEDAREFTRRACCMERVYGCGLRPLRSSPSGYVPFTLQRVRRWIGIGVPSVHCESAEVFSSRIGRELLDQMGRLLRLSEGF